MMKKIVLIYAFIIVAIFQVNFAIAAEAPKIPSAMGILDKAGLDEGAGYSTFNANTGFASLVGRFISVFLSLIGIIFVCLFIYAGYMWMTAGGEAAKVQKAQDLMKTAVIGLIISVSAYAIAYFVTFYLSKDMVNQGIAY